MVHGEVVGWLKKRDFLPVSRTTKANGQFLSLTFHHNMIQYKHQQRETTKHGDNMKVYVGKFRYVYDGETEVIVATTQSRIEQELVKRAQQYVEHFDEEDREQMV